MGSTRPHAASLWRSIGRDYSRVNNAVTWEGFIAYVIYEWLSVDRQTVVKRMRTPQQPGKKNPFQCHFVHHKFLIDWVHHISCINWPWIEPGPHRWDAWRGLLRSSNIVQCELSSYLTVNSTLCKNKCFIL